ncbi:hypothetical protein N864_21700 [Intrasporangium chromatireducens Q5-1]|uniref:Uncharacterized protein n=1 Tax=Intrasporangium chromatireducens Q5-1 TaxID=584657 RepID=W9GR86_9MICO|nr:hypothetical protein N864_21700 [Intrasporangium chromatireducens Q5-1]
MAMAGTHMELMDPAQRLREHKPEPITALLANGPVRWKEECPGCTDPRKLTRSGAVTPARWMLA